MDQILKTISFSFCLFLGGLHLASSSNAAILLQPHQEASVQYLMKHPEQKGLLLYHSLGSGKTYIGLDYAEKNPGKKVVILLPEFLKSNWVSQMKTFGIKDESRYEMVTLDNAEKLLNYDLSNVIVIVDEVHKLIQKIRLSGGSTSENLINVYLKLKSASRILLLTGTPIFVDTSDISFIANLLVETDQYPTDPIKFRTEFMKIKPVTSLVRGHITESKLMMIGLPFVATLTGIVTFGTALPWAVPIFALGGSAVVPIVNESFPVNQVSFREFDTAKWKDFTRKFVSYYDVKFSENENYPSKKISNQKVMYSYPQADFFLSFADEDLSIDQLKVMLADEKTHQSDQYLKIHSARIQKQLLGNHFSGREIGNLEFSDKSGDSKQKKIIESPKFLQILNFIKTQPGKVAVYSNYFEMGICKFAKFLERNGFGEQYTLLDPSDSTAIQTQKLEQYNQGEKRILLIHPEITEGISLIGTEQFHILEPIGNSALSDQIIGRAIRYKSHTHLPKSRQMVHVYLWESTIEYSKLFLPTTYGFLRREHWQKNYSEVNPSMWSKGITELDSNYFLKDETPDQRVSRRKNAIQTDLEQFKKLLQDHSIEKAE